MYLAEALETTRRPRVAGLTGARTAVVAMRPCRAPRHTIAAVGRIGGGQVPMPGEVSRAHQGMRLLHVVSKDPWGQGVSVLGPAMMGSHDCELRFPRGRDDGPPCLEMGGIEPASTWGVRL
jgi:hypothetical protein